MWDAVKAVLKGKFITLYANIRKVERYKINDLSFHLKKVSQRRAT